MEPAGCSEEFCSVSLSTFFGRYEIDLGHSQIPASHSIGIPFFPTTAPASARRIAPTVSVSPPQSTAVASAVRNSSVANGNLRAVRSKDGEVRG